MSVEHAEFFAALAAPFGPEVKTRNQGGKTLSYITARTVMNRLDEVCGPAGWRDEYAETKDGMKCTLWIKTPDGEWISKHDGGGFANCPDEDDSEKSAYSGSFKRAAVKWGLGRHLYGEGIPRFAEQVLGLPAFYHDNGQPAARSPSWAEPAPQRQESTRPTQSPASTAPAPSGGNGDAPRNGRALFAWTKDQDEKNDYGLLKHINGWAKRQDGWPDRMVDWNEQAVALAYTEACRKIRAIRSMQATTEAALDNGMPEPPPRRDPRPASAPASFDFGDLGAMPTSGGGMFAWAKGKEDKEGLPDVLRNVSSIGKRLGLPDRMKDWGADGLKAVWGEILAATGRRDHEPVPAAASGGQDMDESEIPF